MDDDGRKVGIIGIQRSISLRMISTMQFKWCMHRGCHLFAVTLEDMDEEQSHEAALDHHPILLEYIDVFPSDILGMPPR